VFALLLGAPVPASAAVVYDFSFTNLRTNSGTSLGDFGIALVYDDYVTTTGMAPVPGGPFATTLGYPVNFAGTASNGYWGFDDDTAATIGDLGYSFGGESFVFTPTIVFNVYYVDRPMLLAGTVSGNAAAGFFRGDAMLNVREVAAPEPGTAGLYALALAATASLRRARRRFG
jgi:hypothetical protein